jgi:hypothetical protein
MVQQEQIAVRTGRAESGAGFCGVVRSPVEENIALFSG